ERAGACKKGDRIEASGESVDPCRNISLEGEGRVLEPRLEHLRVAGRDDVGLAAVRDQREAVALDREVALVRLHRRHDHALRKLKEALVEAAVKHNRLLDEVD